MVIYLLPNTDKPEAFKVAQQCAQLLASRGVKLVTSAENEGRLPAGETAPVAFLPAGDAWNTCDMVLTIGGDGTMLHAAKHAMEHQKPLLGVNTGRLGFLTLLEKDELEELARIPAGDYLVEQRDVVEIGCGGEVFRALNDIVFFKSSVEKTIILDIYCDDVFVSRTRGDGVVFATPTGSTAYSMSAGGPVVDAKIPSITVTQICAHIVRTPPLVFAQNRQIRVAHGDGCAEQVFVSCDGHPPFVFAKDAEAVVRLSESTVPLVCFSDADQLKSIDKKLKGR